MGKRRGRGEGSIYQRDDGRWIGAVDLGWISGKRARKVVNGRTRAEVVKRLQEVQPTVAQGLTLAPDRLTVETYLADWISKRIPGTVSLRTEALYLRAVGVYINPSIGKVRLTKLTPSDVSGMLADLETQGYSPSTRRMARATLRRALRFAEQDGLLSRNVAAIAEGPKLDRREGRSLTPEQAQAFLGAVVGNRLEAAYVITLALGLRRGEVLGLSWEDVVSAENAVVMTVRRQLVRDKGGVHLSDLKTAGSRRTLHLSEPLVEVLERHRRRQEAEVLVRGKRWNNESGLIFTSTIGTPLDPEQFGKTVPKICESAGLGHWSIHELRHSCASLLIAMEVPLEIVSEQMGHASIRVTKDVYGHLMPKARARAAEAMRTVLFDAIVPACPPLFTGLATQLATSDAANSYSEPVNRTFVGRPGLDPGTLGLKEGCIWSDWSGGVGMVCGMKCGIFERTVQLSITLAHVRSRNDTLKSSATSCAFANLGCETPRVCSPKFPTRFRFKSYKAHGSDWLVPVHYPANALAVRPISGSHDDAVAFRSPSQKYAAGHTDIHRPLAGRLTDFPKAIRQTLTGGMVTAFTS